MGTISSRWTRTILVATLVCAAVASAAVYDRLFRARPAPYFESDQDHFLHGSIGAESTDGVPYWIWLVLPRIVPDLLPGPGGYASLGMLARQGHDLPIGLSRVTIGYPRVATNCAFCHTAAVRSAPGAQPALVPGAPAHQTSVQQYRRFLAAAASDPRFNAGTILGEIARNYRLSAIDRLLYRFVVIPGTRQRLLRLRDESGWMAEHPDWGAGRADVFNPLKFHRLGQRAEAAAGSADMMPLWNSGRPQSRGFFWDGMHTSLQDAVVTSALSAGASRPWLDDDIGRWNEADARETSSLRRIQNYISTLTPPAYPFPIDRELAERGAAAFSAECAHCHTASEARAPEIAAASAAGIAAAPPGTDPHRRGVWTTSASAAYDAFSSGRAWKSSGFRSGDEYVAVPLDGAWLRAPYLHNGSVPTLRDLLEAPDARPATFWRGYDVYDAANVGFVSTGAGAARVGTLHDTALPGNSNAGHAYGTTLPAETKRALLEYLKTL
jgi:mono/diheme cytochrome c family protein